MYTVKETKQETGQQAKYSGGLYYSPWRHAAPKLGWVSRSDAYEVTFMGKACLYRVNKFGLHLESLECLTLIYKGSHGSDLG